MSQLGKALFTATQRNVLGLLYAHPEQSFYTKEILRLTGMDIFRVRVKTKVVLVWLSNNFYSDPNASKLRELSIIVGCAVRTKIPASRNFYGAHGAPYTGKHS